MKITIEIYQHLIGPIKVKHKAKFKI